MQTDQLRSAMRLNALSTNSSMPNSKNRLHLRLCDRQQRQVYKDGEVSSDQWKQKLKQLGLRRFQNRRPPKTHMRVAKNGAYDQIKKSSIEDLVGVGKQKFIVLPDMRADNTLRSQHILKSRNEISSMNFELYKRQSRSRQVLSIPTDSQLNAQRCLQIGFGHGGQSRSPRSKPFAAFTTSEIGHLSSCDPIVDTASPSASHESTLHSLLSLRDISLKEGPEKLANGHLVSKSEDTRTRASKIEAEDFLSRQILEQRGRGRVEAMRTGKLSAEPLQDVD